MSGGAPDHDQADRWIRLGLLGFAAGLALIVSWGHVLGHDEAVYAVGGRALWSGGPDSGWAPFRSVGMRLVAIPGVWLGGSEPALRLAPAALSLGTVALLAHAGRRWIGGAATALAVATLVCVPYFVRHSAELLSDTPSLGLALGVLLVVTTELARPDGPRWRLLAAAPLAAAAFYVRYGSLQLLVAIAVVCAVAYGRAIVRRPGPVIATLALAAALLVPHALQAMERTGSPLGILRASAAATTQAYVGDGLVYYVKTWPFVLFQLVGGVITAIGLVAGARWAWRRAAQDRTAVVLWAIAVIHAVWVGLSAHGERRYMFPALALLSLVGSRAVIMWWRARARTPGASRLAIGALVVAAGVSLVHAAVIVRMSDRFSRINVEVAGHIRADAGGASCAVLGSAIPHLTWYAGCAAAAVGDDPEAALAALPGERRYVVLLATAPRREPTPAVRERLRAALAAHLVARLVDASSRHNDAEIYRADAWRAP